MRVYNHNTHPYSPTHPPTPPSMWLPVLRLSLLLPPFIVPPEH